MRLVVGLLTVVLGGSLAFAEDVKRPEPKPEAHADSPRSKVPLRVVRILPESHQALLFDRNRGTHVLAELGGTVEGFTVDSIDDDEVTLSANGTQIVLAAPDQSWRRARDHRTAAADDPAPADPYAVTPDSAEGQAIAKAEGPLDPYADNKDMTAPVDPYAEPKAIEPTTAVPAPTTAVPAPITDAPKTDAPADAPKAPEPLTVALARHDVGLALTDFGKLMGGVRGSFTPAGAKIDAVIEGSLFARAGLRAGDVITAIDGVPLRSIDGAAELYARASTVKALAVQVQRAGKPATLRITIQ